MFPQHDTSLPPNATITLLNGTPVARVISDPLPTSPITSTTSSTTTSTTKTASQRARSDTSNLVLPSTTFSIDYCPKRQRPSQLKQQAFLPRSYVPFKDNHSSQKLNSFGNPTLSFQQLSDSSSSSNSFKQQPLQLSQSNFSPENNYHPDHLQQQPPVLRTLSFRTNSEEEKQQDPRRSASARLYDPNTIDSSFLSRWFPFGKNYFQHKPFREAEKSIETTQSDQKIHAAVDVQARRRGIEQQILKEQQEREILQRKSVDKQVDPSSEEEDEDHHIHLWKEEHYQDSSVELLLSPGSDDDDIENPRSPSLNSSPSDTLVVPQTHPSMELSSYQSYPQIEYGISSNKTCAPATSQVDTGDRRKSDHTMHPQHHRIPQLTLPPLPSWQDDIDDPEANEYELNRGMVLGLSSQIDHDNFSSKDANPCNDTVSDHLEKLAEQNANQVSFPSPQELSDENDQDALDDDDECASPLSSDASTPGSVSPLNYYIHNGYRYDGDVFELRPPQERSIASRPERILEFKPALLSHRQVFHRVYSEGTYNARPSSLRAQPKRIQSRGSPSTPRSLSTLLSPESSPTRHNDTSANTHLLALTDEHLAMDIPGQEPVPRPVKRPGSTRPPPVDTSATAIAVAATAAAIESSKLSPNADAIAAVATAAAVAARDVRVAARQRAALAQDVEDFQSMPAIIPPRSYRQPGFCETIEAVKQSANAQRNHNLQGLIAFSGVPVTKIEGGKPNHQASKSSSSSSGERRPRRASDLNPEKINKSLYADPVYHEGEDENRHPGLLREKRGRSYTSFATNNPYGRKQRDNEKDNDLRLTEKDAHPRVTIHKQSSQQRERESTSSNGKRSHFWKILSR